MTGIDCAHLQTSVEFCLGCAAAVQLQFLLMVDGAGGSLSSSIRTAFKAGRLCGRNLCGRSVVGEVLTLPHTSAEVDDLA